VAEVGYGIVRLADGARKAPLKETADQLSSAFAGHVLAFDADAAALYAAIVGDRERAGAPIDGFDAQLAAICRAHSATLATRNVKTSPTRESTSSIRATTVHSAAAEHHIANGRAALRDERASRC
jgi:predicted nucleic acid-binding protein